MAAVCQALTYHPRMDQAEWILRSHVLHCELIQPIPFFGRAVFESKAGGALRFYLESKASPLANGQASLRSVAPRWNPDLPELEIGLVNTTRSSIPLELDEARATRLLSELYQGRSPRFLRRAWYAEDEAIEVGLSSVTFRSAYQQYRHCLAELAPVGFDQLERTRVHFDSDEWELTADGIDWLNIMADYLVRADDVERVFIDGHTDNTHSQSYNVELSKKRAESVQHYLVSKGVSPNQISLRYHGERFPVKENTTEEGKAYNRRVTIRVQLAAPVLAQY